MAYRQLTCLKCSAIVPGDRMAEHFRVVHPEIKFTVERSISGGLYYRCDICDARSTGFRQLLHHQTLRGHLEKTRGRLNPLVQAAIDRGARIVEVQREPIPEPPDVIDTFLENLTAKVSEMQQLRRDNAILRQERDALRQIAAASQEKIKRWCLLITQLQEALAKRD